MAGAIQPRINKAIEDRLRADADLLELLRAAGGLLEPGLTMPIYLYTAPTSASLPYISYAPRDPEMSVSPLRAGAEGDGEIDYQIAYVVEGVDAYGTIAITDRMAALMDGYTTTVSSEKLNFLRTGSVFFVDFGAREHGVTVCGDIYRVLTRPSS